MLAIPAVPAGALYPSTIMNLPSADLVISPSEVAEPLVTSWPMPLDGILTVFVSVPVVEYSLTKIAVPTPDSAADPSPTCRTTMFPEVNDWAFTVLKQKNDNAKMASVSLEIFFMWRVNFFYSAQICGNVVNWECEVNYTLFIFLR